MARNKTIDELLDTIHDLSAKRKALKAEQIKLHAQLDALLAEQAAHDRLASMSDAEKRAMAQQLQAEGIGSGEVFGTPGAS